METATIYILIPAFNEERKIGSVIRSLQAHNYTNILVVNDGSTDQTAAIAEEQGAEIISLLMNRGQGAALRMGIEYLREIKDPKIIITFDADGQHKPEDLAKLTRPILQDEADIVLGSRFLDKKSDIPIAKILVLRLGVLFTNIISGIHLTDTHNGLRALGKKAIKNIRLTQRRMEHASEIIDEIARNKLRYKEVPVEIIYSEYAKLKGQKASEFIKLGVKIILNKIRK